MKIITVKCLTDNYSYIIFNEKTSIAIAIDPSEADPLITEIEKKKFKIKIYFKYSPPF